MDITVLLGYADNGTERLEAAITVLLYRLTSDSFNSISVIAPYHAPVSDT